MCGRYSLTTTPEAMRRLFGISGPLPGLPARYNVAPTQQVPIVRAVRSARYGREIALVRWGLIPFWAKDTTIGHKLINARAETMAREQAFREALRLGRRCLIPADGFYEWKKEAAAKQLWRITLADERPFAFAGLWERWEKARDAVPVESCTIITTAANGIVATFDDRMPVILLPDDYAAWLGDDALYDTVKLLQPYPSSEMRLRRVNATLNNVRNDRPECPAPVKAQLQADGIVDELDIWPVGNLLLQ